MPVLVFCFKNEKMHYCTNNWHEVTPLINFVQFIRRDTETRGKNRSTRDIDAGAHLKIENYRIIYAKIKQVASNGPKTRLSRKVSQLRARLTGGTFGKRLAK